MSNSLAPGFIVLHSTCQFGTTLRPHKQTIPVLPAALYSPGQVPSFLVKDQTELTIQAAIDEYLTYLEPLFSNQTQWTHAEYWRKDQPNDDPTYIYTYVMTGKIGTGGANVSAGQVTISLRSEGGGIGKVVLVEGNTSITLVDQFPFSNLDLDALGDYLTGDTSLFVARDGGYYVTPYRAVGKLNDALRRRYILGA